MFNLSTIIIIIPILVILLGLYLIFRRDSIEGVVPAAVFFIVFGVAFLLFSIYFNKYGSSRIYNALKDYGVKYVDNQKYQKGSFEFTYDSYGKDGTKYVLIDSDDYDFELHKTAINLAIDIDAESLQMIYEYLKSYSKETNQKSSVVIVKLNSKIELTYDYSNSVFKHTMYRVYDGSDEDPNEDYNELYSHPELEIEHNVEDRSFDSKLLKLLFKKELSDFKISKQGNRYNYVGYRSLLY